MNTYTVRHTHIAADRIRQLQALLPTWHFKPYGAGGAVACFPPGYPNREFWDQLVAVAPIGGVCGPFYSVTRLHSESPAQGWPSQTIQAPTAHAAATQILGRAVFAGGSIHSQSIRYVSDPSGHEAHVYIQKT